MKKQILSLALALVAFLASSCSDDKRDAIGRTEVVIETSRGNITARLYDELGMAEYQAIEVFVKLF